MNRITRRTIAAAGGLCLGWFAAGYIPALTATHLHAEDRPHHETEVTDHASATNDHAAPDTDHRATAAAHHADPGRDAANLLVPANEDVGWYRPMLFTIGGLFAAAVLIGVPMMKLKAPEPAAAAHDADAHH